MLVHGTAVIKLLFFIARGSCYRNCCDARVLHVTLFNPEEDKHSLLRICTVVWGLPDRRHRIQENSWTVLTGGTHYTLRRRALISGELKQGMALTEMERMPISRNSLVCSDL